MGSLKIKPGPVSLKRLTKKLCNYSGGCKPLFPRLLAEKLKNYKSIIEIKEGSKENGGTAKAGNNSE